MNINMKSGSDRGRQAEEKNSFHAFPHSALLSPVLMYHCSNKTISNLAALIILCVAVHFLCTHEHNPARVSSTGTDPAPSTAGSSSGSSSSPSPVSFTAPSPVLSSTSDSQSGQTKQIPTQTQKQSKHDELEEEETDDNEYDENPTPLASAAHLDLQAALSKDVERQRQNSPPSDDVVERTLVLLKQMQRPCLRANSLLFQEMMKKQARSSLRFSGILRSMPESERDAHCLSGEIFAKWAYWLLQPLEEIADSDLDLMMAICLAEESHRDLKSLLKEDEHGTPPRPIEKRWWPPAADFIKGRSKQSLEIEIAARDTYFTYHTNLIEGSTLSLIQTQNVPG